MSGLTVEEVWEQSLRESIVVTFPICDTTYTVQVPVPPVLPGYVVEQAKAIAVGIFRDDARKAGYTNPQIIYAISGMTWEWSSDANA